MTHPNVEFILCFYDLFARGEMQRASELLSDDFVFFPAGKHCKLAGRRYGARGIMEFTQLQRDLTHSTWVPRPYDALASDNHVAVLVTVTATRNGCTREFHLVHVWQIANHHATELRSHVDDQYAYDQFFAD
jgi:ketosteroid isomerase-like protein